MPHVAFYRVVSDLKELDFPSGGNTQELTFNATNDIVLNESSARPMVCFQWTPVRNETPKANIQVFVRHTAGDHKICSLTCPARHIVDHGAGQPDW